MLLTEFSRLTFGRPQPPWSSWGSSFSALESLCKLFAVDDPGAFREGVEDNEYCGDDCEGDIDSLVSRFFLVPKLPSSVKETHEQNH